MIREILRTKGASMPINSPYLKEQCTIMAASMPFCAQYRIGLSAEPSSARIKLPTAWNLLSCDEKSDKTIWWVTYFCNSSYRVTYNSYSVQTELMILMPTKTKTNQIASTITESDSKNLFIQPKNAVLDSKLDPTYPTALSTNRIHLK